MRTAHYFASKKGNILIISADLTPVGIKIIVKDKREARKVAQTHGAQPWNF